MKRSRFTQRHPSPAECYRPGYYRWFGIEKPFPWLLLAIGTAEVLAATAACVAAIGGALYAAHVWLPADLHDVF